ncbi:SURF1 family protein [Rhabdaerophilum calidifontis]|uniref:SURF1 family protein n=1 Tax=Rhabdaerophilum calidifontis TaxID=2604328 RepID=UPI001238E048|nr:SURF1 family cytochrome oxidase biogenesis protein [Rhabdaerophilum calidifontis]
MSWRLRLFLAFIATVTALQAGLGFWQWERRKEKAAFLAAIEQAASSPPRALSGAPLWSRVVLRGRYAHERSAYVRTSRPAGKDGRGGGFGVFVMTPFITRICGTDGKCSLTNVYVNRGFLPTPPDGRIPSHDRPEDPVTVTGFLRPGEKPGLFQPRNDPARDVWFHRSTEEMALRAGLPGAIHAEAASYLYERFIDREAEPGEQAPPFGIEPAAFLAAIPNNHLTYALTWWGLAATNLVVLAVFLRQRRRQDEEAR